MKKRTGLVIILAVVIVFGNVLIDAWKTVYSYKSQSLTEFMNILKSERVSEIKYVYNYESDSTLRYEIGGERFAVKYPAMYLSFNPEILDILAKNGIEVSFKTNPLKSARSFVSGLVSVGLFLLLLMLLRYTSSIVSEDVSAEKSSNEKTTFDDIAGYSRLKEELKEFVDMLKNPEEYRKYHIDIPRGILLSGPPGNGKTLCARAIAGESDTPFFYISASRIENKFVGSGSRRLEKVIREVKKHAQLHGKAILFIDEIDAIGYTRERRTVAETNQTLNTLLVAMDGFDKDDRILFIAATNMADKLDPALVRVGRFDKIINVPQPSFSDRKAVLELYISRKSDIMDPKVMEEEFINFLATRTHGKCCADLRQLVNDACSLARRYKKDLVDEECMREALIRSTIGMETDYVLSEEELRIVAYHEAGHTVARCLLHPKGARSVAYVTTKPYSKSLGHMAPVDDDEVLWRRSSLENQIKMLLAGRAVEEKILGGDFTTGAAEDLRQANNLLFVYVTKYGMYEGEKNMFSENVNEDDEHVRESIAKVRDVLYAETKRLVEENFGLVEKLATYLIEHRFADQETLVELLGEHGREKPA